MIIYGSRMYGVSNVVYSYANCENCGKFGKLKSYNGRKWGHLYFIPLIPNGGKVRVLSECPSCKSGSHLPLQQAEKLEGELEASYAQYIGALESGKRELEDEPGQRPVKVAALLESNLYLYLRLHGIDKTQAIVERVKSTGCKYELFMVEGTFASITGKPKQAVDFYKNAAEIEPENALPHYRQGIALLQVGDLDQALAVLQKVELMEPEDLTLKQKLIDIYNAKKDYKSVAFTYENCFLIVPELKDNKQIVKDYKKACKKAGTQPQL